MLVVLVVSREARVIDGLVGHMLSMIDANHTNGRAMDIDAKRIDRLSICYDLLDERDTHEWKISYSSRRHILSSGDREAVYHMRF